MPAFKTHHAAAVAGLVLSGLAVHGVASAQGFASPTQGDTVTWTVTSADSVKHGGKLTLTLHGEVQDGWHVYGLSQLPDGPTPLKVALDSGDVAAADGAPKGSAPTKLYDPSFNLETQFYAKSFTVAVPVRVASRLAAGKQLIPLAVRFQTCNGKICQPPKTVHLTAPVNVTG